MKLLLTILACLVAASAGAQTVKSLGYNTTNGQVVYSGTNDLRFPATIRIGTNQSGFSSGGQFLTLTDGAGGVAMIIGTNAITSYDPIAFSSTGNAAATRTNLALGETNTVTFSNIQLGLFGTASATGFVGRSSGGQFVLYGTNVTTSVPAFFGWDGFNNTAMSAETSRTNLGLGATNNVTFSNITASGTLTATGNVTLSGVNNTMPGATNAASGSSLMTRELSDARYMGLKSHSINFAMMATKTASGGSSGSSRGSWQIFTATNANSFASAWGAWGYLLGLDGAQQYINFTNPLIISFSRTAATSSLPRAGLFQYVQLGRDVTTISVTNTKLAQKGLGIQFASNGVTPFVHNGTTLTDGSLITNISTYNRFVLRWVPATAFEVYGVANGSEPVLIGSVTSNLPTGIGVSDSALEFMQLDSGSGGANAWFFLNTAYIITP